MPVSKYSQKRKAASNSTSDKPKRPDYYVCTKCGNLFNKAEHRKNFSTVKSKLWISNESKIPICNDCLRSLYDYYLAALGDPYQAYRRLCMQFDIYYCDAIVASVLKNDQSSDRFGAYISQLNYARYQDKTYDNTIEEDKTNSAPAVDITQDDNTDDIREFVEIFGEETGFKKREQEVMLKLYNEQLEHIPPPLVPSLNEMLKDLAKFKILQGRAIAHDDMKEINTYSTQFNAARKYIDSKVEAFKKNAAVEENSVIVGTVAELIENFAPADLWQKPDAFADVDELNENVTQRLLRCVKNFFTGSRESDPTFKLPD